MKTYVVDIYTHQINKRNPCELVKMGDLMDSVNDKIVNILSGSPYDIMKHSLIAGFSLIFVDFMADYLIFHGNRGIIYTLNINLTVPSLWNSLLIILSFSLFGYIIILYRSKQEGERVTVDSYIIRTVEATEALRYNLSSMRLAIHSLNNDFDSKEKVVYSVENGLQISIDLIDSYLENING